MKLFDKGYYLEKEFFIYEEDNKKYINYDNKIQEISNSIKKPFVRSLGCNDKYIFFNIIDNETLTGIEYQYKFRKE